jgi:hypothetical protein
MALSEEKYICQPSDLVFIFGFLELFLEHEMLRFSGQ